MKSVYEIPELVAVGAVDEVVLGAKLATPSDDGVIQSLGEFSVLDID